MFRILLLFTFLALSAYNALMAQFSKGMRMPGITLGSAFFHSGSAEYTPANTNTAGYTSNTNKTGFSLSPALGWFVANDLVVGGQLIGGYTYDKNVDEQNNVTFRKNIYRTFDLGLGIWTRKYFLTGKTFLPFGQLNISGGTGSSKSEGFMYATDYKETYNGRSSGDFFANAGISSGVTKMINDHAGIDIYAGYLYSYRKNTFKTNSERDVDFNGSIDEQGVDEMTTKKKDNGFMIGVAFQLFFGKRKE